MRELNKSPYFSIVMPAYGVEKYIRRAAGSVQRQTYTDWELIIVDDAATDAGAAIAEAMAREDTRIRVLHHSENRGVSAARNTGTREAAGVYIWYMDPDDYAEPQLLESVKESLDKNPAEVVLFGHIEEYFNLQGNLEYTHEICPVQQYYTDRQELRRAVLRLEQQTMYGYVWNKVFQLEYLREQGILFDDVRLIEDIRFNVRFFMDIQRLNVLGSILYHYGKRLDKNLTNAFVPEYFELHRQRIEMLYEQHRYWDLCTPGVRQILGGLYGRYILSALERNCDRRAGMSAADRYRFCRKLFSEELFQKLIPEARADNSRTLAAALFFLRRKNAPLCMMMGRGIYVIRKYFPMLYSKVKSER